MYTLNLVFFFFTSVMKIFTSNKMISILMSMEVMMLSIYFSILFIHLEWFKNSVMVVIFLSFMVCESVLGLGIYIYSTRMAGKDQFKSVSLLK